jgi:hypothetical protein
MPLLNGSFSGFLLAEMILDVKNMSELKWVDDGEATRRGETRRDETRRDTGWDG